MMFILVLNNRFVSIFNLKMPGRIFSDNENVCHNIVLSDSLHVECYYTSHFRQLMSLKQLWLANYNFQLKLMFWLTQRCVEQKNTISHLIVLTCSIDLFHPQIKPTIMVWAVIDKLFKLKTLILDNNWNEMLISRIPQYEKYEEVMRIVLKIVLHKSNPH